MSVLHSQGAEKVRGQKGVQRFATHALNEGSQDIGGVTVHVALAGLRIEG